MATMKSQRENCRSDGERLIYDFFDSKLSDDFWVWNNIEFIHTVSFR